MFGKWKKKSELISDDGTTERTDLFDMMVMGISIAMILFLAYLGVMAFVAAR
ncbi:MAG: hypothetical protein MJ134_01535 [Lachnospiraceae bacterium]|nr:hypothetical protein [Lachnospiraceae bacterium]